jgi:aryl-alcohol dehydrogenase-like predicted oxidoreductase
MIASLATRSSPGEVEATLREAVDAGITCFDTADVYGQGDSERLLGKVIRGQRERMIVCTKAGLTVGPVEGLIRAAKPVANFFLRRWGRGRTMTSQTRRRREKHCFDLQYLEHRIEGSLRRLGIDEIDLFMLHNPAPDMPKVEEVWDLLNRFKQQGKLREVGVSCRSLADAQRWLEHRPVACLQVPIDRSSLEEAIPLLARASALGIGIIAREIFSHDVLSSASIYDAMFPLLQRPEIGLVLAGMTCRRHLHENVQAVERAVECSHVA